MQNTKTPRRRDRRARHGNFTRLLPFASAIALTACLPPPQGEIETEEEVVIRLAEAHGNAAVSGARKAGGAKLAVDVQGVSAKGKGKTCKALDLKVDIEVAAGGLDGTFVPLSDDKITTTCSENAPYDIAIVIDNSGSQASVLDETREGAKDLARRVIDAGGRVSLTRVSTQAKLLSGLTADYALIAQLLDDTFVNRGWTALYDGVRVAQEDIGRSQLTTTIDGASEASCRKMRKTGIVVFTNGADNNSADEKNGEQSDGIATTWKDVSEGNVRDTVIPVFTLGLGDTVDHEKLLRLSNKTGGKFLAISDESALQEAFELVGDYLSESVEVCAELPQACGVTGVRMNYSYLNGKNRITSSSSFETFVDCPEVEPQGRVATILMMMSDPNIGREIAGRLADQTVRWVGGNSGLDVLVVLDDYHHNEMSGDAQLIADLLEERGHRVEYELEPSKGLKEKDLVEYDVVWFTNPGWPMDDYSSYRALESYLGSGGGLVLSGDDMSWSASHSFDMSNVTRLKHSNNGTSACGVTIDNQKNGRYLVTLSNDAHPVLGALAGQSFEYADDIDHSSPLTNDTNVLAWATVKNPRQSCNVRVPVITTHIFGQ